MNKGFLDVAVATVLLLCLGSLAQAVPSTDGWTLTPVVDGNNVTVLISIDNMGDLLAYDGTVTRSWGDPALADASKFIELGTDGGVLQSVTLAIDGDPEVHLDFHYVSSTSYPWTNFTMTSQVVSFPTMSAARAAATAAVTVTDLDGDGATLVGAYGGQIYRAYYGTDTGLYPPSGCIDMLAGPLSADAWASSSADDTMGPLTVTDACSFIQSQYKFSLTSNTAVDGVSLFTFQAVPEPSSVFSLVGGLSGLLLALTRRRKALLMLRDEKHFGSMSGISP